MRNVSRAAVLAAVMIGAPLATAAAASAHHSVTVCDIPSGKQVQIWFQDPDDLANSNDDKNYSEGGFIHLNTPCPVAKDGVDGKDGKDGAAGAKGATGATGDKGATGAQGPKGDIGLTGAKGDKGDTGAAGAPGTPGAAGAAGTNGVDGLPGAPGGVGPAGPTGPGGVAGPVGPTGAPGAKGDKGNQGNQGNPGDKGDTGAKGDKGEKGDKGDAGQKGDQGDSGFTPEITVTDAVGGHNVNFYINDQLVNTFFVADGADGADGSDGTNGSNGLTPTIVSTPIDGGVHVTVTIGETVTGFDVLNGESGIQGVQGLPGTPGAPGVNGVDGKDGKAGVTKTVIVNPDGTKVDVPELPHTGGNSDQTWAIAGVGALALLGGTGFIAAARRRKHAA